MSQNVTGPDDHLAALQAYDERKAEMERQLAQLALRGTDMAMASQQQVGGDHYKTFRIQPAEFSQKNGLGFLEGCVVKRVCRHDQPTGKGREDIEKAIHELQLILEWEYGEAREQSND